VSDAGTGDLTDPAQLIARQIASAPTLTAIAADGGRMSYGELGSRVARLARHLQALGVVPDTTVAVALEPSPEQIVAALAAVMAGVAYVPVDCSYPAARLTLMLDDARPAVLITRTELLGRLPAVPAATVLLDRDGPKIARYPATMPGVSCHPDNLAYVIFTSGSTGRPKAAMNTRLGWRNQLLWHQAVFRLAPGDAVLQLTPLGFDPSILECYWPLLAGARIVVAIPGMQRDPGYLSGLIRAENVTVAHFVPSVLHLFLEDPGAARCESLRRVMVGGEVLTAELAGRFMASGLPAHLDNLYGPAEAAIVASWWRCQADQASSPDSHRHPGGRRADLCRRAHLMDAIRRRTDRVQRPIASPGHASTRTCGAGHDAGSEREPGLTRR
jgi:non-ribosomal peptide synthetase component F